MIMAEESSVTTLHPYYSLLPAYVSKESVLAERDEFIERTLDSLYTLRQLRDGEEKGVKLRKSHLRNIETLFKLKHSLPKDLHRELIEILVWHLWEDDAVHIADVLLEERAVQVLRTLLKEWQRKLPRREARGLVLDWRLAKRAIDRVSFATPGQDRHASSGQLQFLASSMVKCVEKARSLFCSASPDRTTVAELWEAFSPSIKQVKSNECFKSLGYFTLLMNISETSEDVNTKTRAAEWTVIKALLPEWLESWASISRCLGWDGHWFKVFSRVAKRFPRELTASLEPAFPFLFAKVNDWLDLIADLGSPSKINTSPHEFSILDGTKPPDRRAMRLCAFLLSNPRDGERHPANDYILDLIRAVKLFFHPSNELDVAVTVSVSFYSLAKELAARLGREKASTPVLELSSIQDVVEALLDIGFYGIRSTSEEVSATSMLLLEVLVSVDPVLCARRVLDEMVEALDPDALSQSHLAPTAIWSLFVFINHLMYGRHAQGSSLFYSTYLAPLLQLTLPGIDPNDEYKTSGTIKMYSWVLSWLPLVNDVAKSEGSIIATQRQPESVALFEAMQASLFSEIGPNGDDVDLKIWELGGTLEEWSLAVVDRCFQLIEPRVNLKQPERPTDESDHAVLEAFDVMRLLYAQMSPPIYAQALRKTVDFVASSFSTSDFGASIVSKLVSACLHGEATLGIPAFMRLATDSLLPAKSSSLTANERVRGLSILRGITSFNGADSRALLGYRAELKRLLLESLNQENNDEKQVHEAAASVLEGLIHQLVDVYPIERRSLPPEAWRIATSESAGMGQFLGAAVSWRKLALQWHEPSEDELAFAFELLQEHLLGAFRSMEQLRLKSDATVRQWVSLLTTVLSAVRGASSILVDIPPGEGSLARGSMSLLESVCLHNPSLLRELQSLKSTVLVETHKAIAHWRRHGQDGVATVQLWRLLLQITKQLLVWQGKDLSTHQMEGIERAQRSDATVNWASCGLTVVRRFELDPLDVVPLCCRPEMIDRVVFFYSKRRFQEHFEAARYAIDTPGPLRDAYEALLLDVDELRCYHPYEQVCGLAASVMRECSGIYEGWICARVPSALDILEGKIVDASSGYIHEETVTGALELIQWGVVQEYLWESRGPELERVVTALLRSDGVLNQKIETLTARTKIDAQVKSVHLSLIQSWRWVRGGASSGFVSDLLKEEPLAAGHWKNLLLYLASFYPWLHSRESQTLPLGLWQCVIKHLRHDVSPIREAALWLLIRLVAIYVTASSPPQPEVEALLFADSTLVALIECFNDNHRSSAHGEHDQNPANAWPSGVSAVMHLLSSVSLSNPVPPPLSPVRLLNQDGHSLQPLRLHHLQLVAQLCQMNPRVVLQDAIVHKLNQFAMLIDAKSSEEDRNAALTTLAEWVAGILRALLKLPDMPELQAATAQVHTVLRNVMSQINVTLTTPWANAFYFVARPSRHCPDGLHCHRLEPLIRLLLEEVSQAFSHATADDYTNQTKWLTLLQPLLVCILGGEQRPDETGLRTQLQNSVVSLLKAHALTLRYSMVREAVATTLFIMDATGGGSIVAPVIERLVASAHGPERHEEREETPDEFAAKDTSVLLLSSASYYGDATDLAWVVCSLLPVAFLCESHPKADLSTLATNTIDNVAISLRIFAAVRDSTGEREIAVLLATLEAWSHHRLWKTRAAVLRFVSGFAFFHWVYLSAANREKILQLVLSRLADDNRDVQHGAKFTLRGIVPLQRVADVEALIGTLRDAGVDARAKHQSLVRALQLQQKEKEATEDDISTSKARVKSNAATMEASVLGLSAIMLAFPYSVPPFVLPLLEALGQFLYVSPFIETTVKETLLEFKRTHHDTWLEIKRSLTPAQREVLEDVLVAPSYYT